MINPCPRVGLFRMKLYRATKQFQRMATAGELDRARSNGEYRQALAALREHMGSCSDCLEYNRRMAALASQMEWVDEPIQDT